jgi:hypothetical protein
MDLICTNCGEPWDLYHILHDAEPGDFERTGGLVTRCPCCEENSRTPLTQSQRDRLSTIAEMAPLFGDDVDGFACFLEDLAFIFDRDR